MEIINALSGFSRFLSLIIVISFFLIVITFLVWGAIFLFKKKLGLSSLFFKIMGFLFVVFLLALSVTKLMGFLVIKELSESLVSGSSIIEVNGIPLADSSKLKVDLAKRIKTKDSGSNPESSINVTLIDGSKRLDFEFRVDSRNESLFWVYFTKFKNRGSLFYVITEEL